MTFLGNLFIKNRLFWKIDLTKTGFFGKYNPMKRNLEPQLRTILENKKKNEVILIEGARQVGKSYLVNSVLDSLSIPNISFDLEKNISLRRQIDKTEDFEDFRALMTDQYGLRDGYILFLDEAQESRKLAEYIKPVKEDWPEIRMILTGSSMNRIFSKDVRIPVGRTKSLCVYGFNFSEFLKCIGRNELADFIESSPEKVPESRHRLLLELFDQYLLVGGYPEAVKAFRDDAPYTDIIDEITASLTEDFSRKEEYLPGLFKETIRAVSGHLGSPSKYSQIDSTKYNAKAIVEALKLWHIILEVDQFSLDPNRNDFLPKRYLHDLGVINRKRSLVAPSISIIETLNEAMRTPLGGLFENAVLLNLLEGGSAYKTISTWKKGNNTDIEIDFVMDSASLNKKIPIECKATLNLKRKHYKNILHYLNITGEKTGITVTAAPISRTKTDTGHTIINLPVYLATVKNIEAMALK